VCAAVYYFLVRPLRQPSGMGGSADWGRLYLGVNALSGTIWERTHTDSEHLPKRRRDYFTIAGARVYYYVVGDLAR